MTLVSGETIRDGQGDAHRPWWREPFRVFQTNLRETDTVLDVEKTLDAIEEHGSNAWLINAGGILSFYPTRLGHQTRNPHLAERPSGDLLGDAVEAAHARGIRVIARMDFSKVGRRVAEEHPDWLYVGPDGEYQEYQGLFSTCPSAGYYQTAAFEALTEVAERYGVDGFFFNWFGFNEIDYSGRYRGVSQNESSRRGFAEFSGGQELPVGPESENYLTWRAYAGRTIGDLTRRFREHISALLPDACFIRGPGADIIFHEANNELGRLLWPSATSEAVSVAKSADPERPVFVNSVAFVDMPYRLAAEDSAHYEQYIAQTLARGGAPSVYIMGEPGAIDYPNVAAVSPLFRFHRDHHRDYADLRPAAQVAIVRPDSVVLDPIAFGTALAEFRGIYRALQQAHVPFDVVASADLAAALSGPGLAEHRVLVLPDVGPVDPAVAAELDRRVADGLTVVLTGASATGRDGGAQLTHSPVEALGKPLIGQDAYALYAVEPAEPGSHPRHPVVPIIGSSYPMTVRSSAATEFALVPPAPFGPPEKAYGNTVSAAPAIVTAAAGDGSVIVIPWSIGRSFYEVGLSVIGDLIARVVDGARRGHRLRFDLPPHIEVTEQRSEAGTVLHLVNLSGVQGNTFVPPVTAHGGGVISDRPIRATDLRSDSALTVTAVHGGWRVDLPPIGALAVIRIEYEAPLTADEPAARPRTPETTRNDD
ncbi:alpha-amylase family protein [Amnibacterium flavum]|uniref:Beta-galactosidase trimerisation domain-containing protein n=1 Tax=Amnibacterium flavum TaxID=2173173 RepID=A0A2V1HWI2_9MICO|nr:alpha-amylase family protein [Amnibacterium flavum]PVZ95559.1 hypothetical protein DDQ50_03410 [Amnibacterium flavum]